MTQLAVQQVALTHRINLDTVGRVGALAFQYAAVAGLGEGPDGEGAAVIRNAARQDVLGPDDADDLRAGIMDALTDIWGDTRAIADFERQLLVLNAVARDWAAARGRNFGDPVA